MKKRFSIIFLFFILVIIMCFSLSSCGDKTTDNTNDSESKTTTEKQSQTEKTTVEETTQADSEEATNETISIEGDIQTLPATIHTSNLGYTMLYYTESMKFTKTLEADTYNIKNRMTSVIDPNAFIIVTLKTNTTVESVINDVVTLNTITEPIDDTTFSTNNYPAKHAFLQYTSGSTDFTSEFYAIQDGNNVFLITEKYYYVVGSGVSTLLYYSMNTFTLN